MVETQAARAIDVHTHFVPERMPPCPDEAFADKWPSMAPAATCGHCHVMISGKVYRTVTDQCWDAERRSHDMREMGVTLQVLSPMPELLSYWLPAPVAQVLLRDMNEQMAEMVKRHPDQFCAFAAVPLQDVGMAIAELEYAANELKMAGVEIGSNIEGKPIGAPEFVPFFEAAERLGMAVFVHAIRPAGMERLIGPASLEQSVGFPNEIGLSAASVITTNLMVRCPALRIAFSHGGGSLAMILPRLQHAWGAFPALKGAMEMSPAEQAKRLYYDALVYDRATLRHLIERFGADRLMVGTDYPFQIMERDPLGRLAEADLGGPTTNGLRYRNAERYLGARVGARVGACAPTK